MPKTHGQPPNGPPTGCLVSFLPLPLIGETVRYLPHRKKPRLFLKLSLMRESRQKICQGQPPAFGSQCSKFHPNRFIFGGVIAERVKAVLLAHRVFATFVFGRIKSSKTENCSEGLSQDNCCNNGIPQYGSLNTQ